MFGLFPCLRFITEYFCEKFLCFLLIFDMFNGLGRFKSPGDLPLIVLEQVSIVKIAFRVHFEHILDNRIDVVVAYSLWYLSDKPRYTSFHFRCVYYMFSVLFKLVHWGKRDNKYCVKFLQVVLDNLLTPTALCIKVEKRDNICIHTCHTKFSPTHTLM